MTNADISLILTCNVTFVDLSLISICIFLNPFPLILSKIFRFFNYGARCHVIETCMALHLETIWLGKPRKQTNSWLLVCVHVFQHSGKMSFGFQFGPQIMYFW